MATLRLTGKDEVAFTLSIGRLEAGEENTPVLLMATDGPYLGTYPIRGNYNMLNRLACDVLHRVGPGTEHADQDV
jgi:hypothetical protein